LGVGFATFEEILATGLFNSLFLIKLFPFFGAYEGGYFPED